MVRVCKKCGKLFDAITAKYIFCPSCRGTWQYRPPAKRKIVKCATCGKDFISIRVSQKYCCDNCRAKGNSKKVFFEIVCPVCGKTFKTSTHRKKHCSHECYLRAKSIRDSERRINAIS